MKGFFPRSNGAGGKKLSRIWVPTEADAAPTGPNPREDNMEWGGAWGGDCAVAGELFWSWGWGKWARATVRFMIWARAGARIWAASHGKLRGGKGESKWPKQTPEADNWGTGSRGADSQESQGAGDSLLILLLPPLAPLLLLSLLQQ